MAKKRKQSDRKARAGKNESGNPGGGVGRVDDVGRTGIWPVSGPVPEGRDMPIVSQAELGQGTRGPAGAADSGGSETRAEDVVRPDTREHKRRKPA